MDGGQESATAAAENEMELDFSRGGVVPTFDFAFNSANFSDRVLRIVVVSNDEAAGGSLPEEKGAYSDWRY